MKAFTWKTTHNAFPNREAIEIIEDDGTEDGGRVLAALPGDSDAETILKVARAVDVEHVRFEHN